MSWYTSNRSSRLPDNWDQLRDEMIKPDTQCAIKGSDCQVQATELDHKIPGDDHRRSNLQPACERCHARKSALEGVAKKRKMKALSKRKPERHPGSRF